MMCYYLNVHFQGQRVNIKKIRTFIFVPNFNSSDKYLESYMRIILLH